MCKILFVVFNFFLIAGSLHAQSLKTYSGPYTAKVNGQATYTYYEKDGLEVRQGNFSFSASEGGKKPAHLSIRGNYEKDLKTGLWTYNITYGAKNVSETTILMRANYSKGLPNGSWTTTLYEKKASQTLLDVKTSVNFKDGMFTNQFTYHVNGPNQLEDIQIELDNKGFYVSERIRKNQESLSNTYYKGVLIDKERGFENIKTIVDKMLLQPNQPRNLPYKLVKRQNELPSTSNHLLFNVLCLFADIKGDVNYQSTSYDDKVDYNYDGFYYYTLENADLDRYQKYIAQADQSFAQYDFVTSARAYQNASYIMPDDLYSRSKTILINDFHDNLNHYHEMASDFEKKHQLDSAIHYAKVVRQFNSEPTTLNSLCWYLILGKKSEEALPLLEKELAKAPQSEEYYPFLLGNKAHAYLLTNQVDKAKAIYLDPKNMNLKLNDKSWSETVVADFNEFIDFGIKNDYYMEIAELLNKKELLKKAP